MVFEGGFHFLKDTVIFDPIDRIWIFGGFSAFCPLRDGFICHILSMGLENDLFCLNPRDSIYSRMATDFCVCGHIYMYMCIYICTYTYTYICTYMYIWDLVGPCNY